MTGKDRPAKPEEIVRQLYLNRLMDRFGYPVERIAVEKPVWFGSSVHGKATDIVVWDKDDKTAAQIIIEFKKPKRTDRLEQLKSYLNAEGAPIGVGTNGGDQTTLNRRDHKYFLNLNDIPAVGQTLSELLNERWTLEDLADHNVLTPEEIEPELLLVYLRLPLVCELLDLHTTASMYPAISTTEPKDTHLLTGRGHPQADRH